MAKQHGYKKYMKNNAQRQENSLLKIFIISFFGMLLVFTFLIKSLSPSVDTSIGEYQQEIESFDDSKNNVDDRLAMIQNEDQGRSFSDIVANVDDSVKVSKITSEENSERVSEQVSETTSQSSDSAVAQAEPVYKVYIGTYTSVEQAKVAKDIIQESGQGLNPIVKCVGSNNYTLQVGIFKNKQSAEALLYTVQQNHLPGRIVQDY